jgi:hypothetical protein
MTLNQAEAAEKKKKLMLEGWQKVKTRGVGALRNHFTGYMQYICPNNAVPKLRLIKKKKDKPLPRILEGKCCGDFKCTVKVNEKDLDFVTSGQHGVPAQGDDQFRVVRMSFEEGEMDRKLSPEESQVALDPPLSEIIERVVEALRKSKSLLEKAPQSSVVKLPGGRFELYLSK